MAKAKIGVIVMMLKKNFDEIGIYETLRKVKALGYSTIEISQVPMTPENVAEFGRACKDFNIKVAAMSAGLEKVNVPGALNLTDDFDTIVGNAKALNCNFLRMGMLPMHYLTSKENLVTFAHKADDMTDKLAAVGISYYYHTHHYEFAKFEGQYALDIIRDNSKKIGFELDVHWIWRGGVDPVKFIPTYKGRVKLLHLKDLLIVPVYMVDRAKAATEIVRYAEVGEGNLDMKAIIETGLQNGAEYLIVEQDDMYGKDALDCLKTSAENLRKLGYGDLF